ncbi:MAG: agmatinase [Bacteriovoracaceae bacterium]|jgi:agmatinase
MLKPNELFYQSKFAESLDSSGVYLLGFGFDGTACFRKGTKDGPDGLRDVSDGIESYSPYLDRDITELSLFDLGNLPVGSTDDIEQNWWQAVNSFRDLVHEVNLEEKAIKLLTLGGEHSISYAPIVKMLQSYPDLVILHLDAHADLRDGYEGYHYSHASIIRRVLDHMSIDQELIQYGIRSGTKEEYRYMKDNGTLCTSRKEFLEKVEAISKDRPVYLTLDLDYFDPSFLPGTGTPEPGGEDFHSFISLVKILMNKKLVGADVVELSPSIDSTGNSSVFAAKVVRELILALAEEWK